MPNSACIWRIPLFYSSEPSLLTPNKIFISDALQFKSAFEGRDFMLNKFHYVWKVFGNKAQSANCNIPQNFNYSNQIIHSLIISADSTQTAGCSCSSLLSPVRLHGNVFDDSVLQPLLAFVRHLTGALAGNGRLGEREPSFLITHCYSQSRALSAEAPFGPLPPVPGLLWVNSLINNQAN